MILENLPFFGGSFVMYLLAMSRVNGHQYFAILLFEEAIKQLRY